MADVCICLFVSLMGLSLNQSLFSCRHTRCNNNVLLQCAAECCHMGLQRVTVCYSVLSCGLHGVAGRCSV